MGLLSRTASLLRNVFRRARVERELDEEVRAYLEMLVDDKVARGMSREEALRAAHMEVGGESLKEQVRDVRAGALLEEFVMDVRFGLRGLCRTPGFAAVAI